MAHCAPPSDAAGPAVVLTAADLASLQGISSFMKVVREPVRELARVATAGAADPADGADTTSPASVLLARLREQLEITQRILHEYLVNVPGVPADHPALTRRHRIRGEDPAAAHTRTSSRSSARGSHDRPPQRPPRPTSLDVTTTDSPGATAAGRAVLPKPASADGTITPVGACAQVHTPLPDGAAPLGSYAIEKAIVRLWKGSALATAPAAAVNEVCVRLGRRHIAPLEERVPQVPARTLASSSGASPIDIVDLINSLFRSSACENEPSLLTRKIETIPPGIVACAIANSSSQLFERLTVDLVAQYASAGGQSKAVQPALRLLSDHANFLTRLMETTIVFPIHAAERARRIEWWTDVACLLRELGDYESLSSLVCVFSGAAAGRLHESWALVAPQCKAAIRFILERVLKIHPNYSSYRSELRMRMRRSQKKCAHPAMGAARRGGGPSPVDDESLDFDSAIAINTPDLCSSDDNYVNSTVFCKEGFDLPPPRVLVPIVAVLLKDAVAAEASDSSAAAASRARAANSAARADPALHWKAIIECCRNSALPLALDYFMLRRIFATELSALPQLAARAGQGSMPRGARSTATGFLRLMPRRTSSLGRASSKELSVAPCRLRGGARCVPNILDMLAHLLYVAAGNSCFSCSMGSLLEPVHVATSGQLAVVVTSMMLFSEPWMPHEYLVRLCDIREPRTQPQQQQQQHPRSFRSPPPLPPPLPPPPVTNARLSMASHSHGYESRSAERSWLMSFKLTDSTEAARYFKSKGGDAKDDASTRPGSSGSSSGSSTRLVAEPPHAPDASDRRSRRHLRSLSLHTPLSRADGAGGPPPLPEYVPRARPPLPPPPLPAAEMPTWMPAAAKPAQQPPPLPSQPMPHFQPPAAAGKMPPIFTTVQPDSPTRQKHRDSISAETQMLLRFDSKSRRQ